MSQPNIYQRLMSSRLALQSADLKKTGHNKFAGYKYFELGDFLPKVQEIFNAHGLLGVVSYSQEEASLTIINIDNPEERIVIGTPMSSAALKGAHEIQNLGAVQTYLRRYLWVTAMEIVEHDAIDSTTGRDEKPIKISNKPIKVDVEQDTEIDDIKFDQYITIIKKAQDMAALKKTWIGIPKHYRECLEDVKDNQKRVIEAMGKTND